MSESLKPRFAVDLDEIERQLAQSQAAREQEPYRSRGRRPASRRGRHRAAAIRSPNSPASSGRTIRSSRCWRATGARYARHARAAITARPTTSATTRGRSPPSPTIRPDQDLPYDPTPALAPPPPADPARGWARRRGLALSAGWSAVAVARPRRRAYAIKAARPPAPAASRRSSRPRTTRSKVAPQNPGGSRDPEPEQADLRARASDGQTKVVNREEQPSTSARPCAPLPRLPADSNLGEPKRVRTVAVRPDGR